MNIQDFKAGDNVLCVDYTRRSDPKFIDMTVDSIGRKYVRCKTKYGVYSFCEANGMYSEHYLTSSDDMLYLFKNQSGYNDYLEHMELNRQLSRLTTMSLSLNQLRIIKMVAEGQNELMPDDVVEAQQMRVPKMPKKSAIDGVGRCPTCGESLHRFDSIYLECSPSFCKWCGQALNWYAFDSEEVSDEVKNTD